MAKWSHFSILLFSVFILQACSKQASSSNSSLKSQIQSGTATQADLVKENGQPEVKEKSTLKTSTEIYKYKDKNHFQVEGEKVTAQFRNPEGAEVSLSYWLQKFHDCPYTKVKASDYHEHNRTFEYRCQKSGEAIIFNQSYGQVTRVVAYAKK